MLLLGTERIYMSKQPGWIYVLETSSLPHGIYKIGHTKNWIGKNINGTSRRKGVLQTALPHEIHPIALFLVSNMDDAEGFLQNMYSQNNLQYDGGGTEWFFLPQNHIDIISKYSDVLCDGEEGLNNISEQERKVKFLQKRKEESKENQQFDLLKIKLFNLNTRKHLYLKHGAAFCQGVFEDGKFIVLKGSIISDHGIDISRHTKDSKHPLKTLFKLMTLGSNLNECAKLILWEDMF